MGNECCVSARSSRLRETGILTGWRVPAPQSSIRLFLPLPVEWIQAERLQTIRLRTG
jgi:hypothetical protein